MEKLNCEECKDRRCKRADDILGQCVGGELEHKLDAERLITSIAIVFNIILLIYIMVGDR